MSIYETMDQFKIFFGKVAQWFNNRTHELAFWMVSNLGHTYPFAYCLMNIIEAERNSTYSSEMNVPKNCKKFEECL
jgi:hypothetical protein